MFKKSLIAVSVLGAVAFSTQAAEVTLYGKIDTGLLYQNQQVEVNGDKLTDTDTFQDSQHRHTQLLCHLESPPSHV